MVTEAVTESVREVPVATRPTGDPQILGWPVFVVGSLVLGLQLVGFVPQELSGAPLAVLFVATGLGLFVSTIWAAYLGQTVVVGAFGVFAGFWSSYPILVLGLLNNWFLIPEEAVTDTVVAFLIGWSTVVFFLTISLFRLPAAYAIVVGLADTALIILAIATQIENVTLTYAGGATVFAFAAGGIYIWLNVADVSTGGRGWPPLGPPVIK